VTIPADSHELSMLVVVCRDPRSVSKRKKKGRRIEDILDEKMERISVLQQISATIADVVEPEFMGMRNFQEEGNGDVSSAWDRETKKITSIPGAMPDLIGLSLRKGLRLLEGSPIEIKIEGTGRIVRQAPPPGTPLKQDMECRLILERPEELDFERIPGPKAQ